MSLTETKLNKHHGRKRDTTIELPDREGLVARVGRSGKISWVFRYRFNGKHKRITFGSYPAVSLKKAKEKAVSYIGALEQGDDPKYAQEDKRYTSIEDCRDTWLDNYVSGLKETTQRNYRSIAGKYFINSRFPHDVQKARFEYWLAFFDGIAKESSKVNSGSVLKTTKSMLRFCMARGLISSSRVFDIELRAVGISAKTGQRVLSLSEVGRLWLTVEKSIAKPSMKICTKLLMIYGARQSEVRQAMRSEFDLKQGTWTVPAERSKTNKAIRRPIPEKAKALIIELDAIYGDKGYLIKGLHPNTCATAHAVNRFVKRCWGKMSSEQKTQEFTPHDFRRTLSTRLSERNILPHVTEKMLGHELGGVMAVYNKHDWIEEQRAAYELWCEMIGNAASESLSGLI